MKPQIQAKVLHITIIILLLLGIVFLSVGYNIAESQGMTTCALKVPGFIELMETYGFKYVNVRICFEGAAEHPRANDTFAGMCNPGKNFAWYVYFVSSFTPAQVAFTASMRHVMISMLQGRVHGAGEPVHREHDSRGAAPVFHARTPAASAFLSLLHVAFSPILAFAPNARAC